MRMSRLSMWKGHRTLPEETRQHDQENRVADLPNNFYCKPSINHYVGPDLRGPSISVPFTIRPFQAYLPFNSRVTLRTSLLLFTQIGRSAGSTVLTRRSIEGAVPQLC